MELKANIALPNSDIGTEIIYVKRQFYKDCNTAVELYDDYKLSVLLSDDMAAIMGDHIYNTLCGDIVIFRQEETHFAKIMRTGKHIYLTFLIPPVLLSQICGEEFCYIFSDNSENRSNHISPDDDKRLLILEISEKIVALLGNNKTSSDIKIWALLIELLEITRELYLKNSEKAHTTTPAVIISSMRYISKNYKTIESLSEIAENVGCSITYLTKTFKKHTGKTVWNYLTELRIAHAKHMLDLGAKVSEACFECGFSDLSRFIKIFKSYEKLTPLKYKNKRG